MSYQYITKHDSPNFGYPRGTKGQNKPEFIVIHYWGSNGQSFMQPIQWLCNPNAYASAHYVVEAGKVACIVDCADSAWHVGESEKYNAYVNNHSIGIECRPECTEADLETVAELISDIWKTYGKLPLKMHKDFSSHGYATPCPGPYEFKMKDLQKKAERYFSGKRTLHKVQLGAFENRENAEKLKNELKSKGYEAFIVEVETDE